MQIVCQNVYSPCLMAWEENSRICLHMQLIAILSRIGVYSLNIFNINKEMMFLIHTKTTKHSLSFTSFLLIVVMQRWILLGVILYSYGSTENNIPKSYKESYLISMRNLPTF